MNASVSPRGRANAKKYETLLSFVAYAADSLVRVILRLRKDIVGNCQNYRYKQCNTA